MNKFNQGADKLCSECVEENDRFRQRKSTLFTACYQLFELAFTERNTMAFKCVYDIFEPQARRWVYRHPDFSNTNEDANYFAHTAFVNMYLNIRKYGLDRFANVQALMAFLKTCVFSTVKQAIRENRKVIFNIEDVTMFKSDQPILSKNIEFMEIWKRIIVLIPDETDRLLVHYSFVLDMKPSEIAAKYPETWSDARTVTVALYRIRRILRKDQMLRRLLDLEDD